MATGAQAEQGPEKAQKKTEKKRFFEFILKREINKKNEPIKGEPLTGHFKGSVRLLKESLQIVAEHDDNVKSAIIGVAYELVGEDFAEFLKKEHIKNEMSDALRSAKTNN